MLIKVDFHTHTRFSIDSKTDPIHLVERALAAGLDKIVISDHNSIGGAILAQKAFPNHVIVGEEIRTPEGEILAAFVTEEIPRYTPPLEAIKRFKDQGAFIALSHPFDPHRSSWSEKTLNTIIPMLDAIEVFNARCTKPSYNTDALEFARKHNLPGLAGSDAHFVEELGKAYTILPPFGTAEELRQVITQSEIVGSLTSFSAHLRSSFTKFCKKAQKSNQ